VGIHPPQHTLSVGVLNKTTSSLLKRIANMLQKTLIVFGWLLVFSGITNAFTEYQKAELPFDDPSLVANEGDMGFVPYFSLADAEGEEAKAPNLTDVDEIGISGDTSAPKNGTHFRMPEYLVDEDVLRNVGEPNLKLTDLHKAPSEAASLPGPQPPPTHIPDRVVIDAIDLDAPIVPVNYKEIDYEGETYQQWVAPDMYASGWHRMSSPLGVPGNTVLNGHHNIYGEVFVNLADVESGDMIQVYSGDMRFTYVVANTMILKERFQPVDVRIDNARWIQSSQDERLTLVTCWPYESNTHRVIVVAVPVGVEDLSVDVNDLFE